MSAENSNASLPDPVSFMTAFWSQWLEQSARGTQAMLEVMQSNTDPQALQQKGLEALSDQMEQFMRTPAFMEMMRRNLKAMTDFKQMQDQLIHGTARQLGMPLADDLFGLFERLHSDQQSVASRLGVIEERLDSIEAHVMGGESNGTPRKRATGRSRTKTDG
jgi:hypothetical protein